jgi:hypothetical protein
MYEFILWLAYADVIDNKIEKIKQGLVEFKNKLYGTGNAIQSITKTLDKLFQTSGRTVSTSRQYYQATGSCV